MSRKKRIQKVDSIAASLNFTISFGQDIFFRVIARNKQFLVVDT
ncbi:hypothetical protein [Candidatus Liberibacter africanus]|nr:hypothetical protein [Candidatus Liberibacter africanus]